MNARVGVVGGGIAGLVAAWHLVRAAPELEVTVLEGASRVGGKLRVEQVGGLTVDVGAEAVLTFRPEAMQLFDELGVADRVAHPAPVPASIVIDGARRPMPKGTLMGVPADPEAVRGLLTDAEVDRLRSEVLTPPVHGDIAVGTFVDARLGPAVTDKLIEPLLAGVYAGDSRNLSLEMAVPQLAKAAREGTSLLELSRSLVPPASPGSEGARRPVFATIAGGLGLVPEILALRLRDLGVTVRTGAMVRGLARRDGRFVVSSGPTTDVREDLFDDVILATPAAPTARLLRGLAPEAASRLARIESASMAIVTLVLDGPPPEVLDGSGFLVPPTEQTTIKASTFSTVKWPWLAAAYPDHTVLRTSLGRHREEATLQRSDEELVEVSLADLAAVLGPSLPAPAAVHVQRWGGGLPQYAVGHRALVEGLAEPAPGIALAGAALSGVGVPACIASGRRAAEAVLTRVRADRRGLG